MNLNQVGLLLTSHPWQFAKTMPWMPHWYTLRRTWESDADFEMVVEYIRKNGYKAIFGNREYIYLNINEHKYWTMGSPVKETILINRAIITAQSEYDEIASVYDGLFTDQDSLAENEEVIAMLRPSGKVLDIGCGSGLLLDYCDLDEYTGIDPSRKMLDVLVSKHPEHASNVVNCRFEDFVGADYDLIVSLFASASYVEPEALSRIFDMLRPGGRYFMMFYKPDYVPVTYQKSGVFVDHFQYDPRFLPGRVIEYHNFLIVEGYVG